MTQCIISPMLSQRVLPLLFLMRNVRIRQMDALAVVARMEEHFKNLTYGSSLSFSLLPLRNGKNISSVAAWANRLELRWKLVEKLSPLLKGREELQRLLMPGTRPKRGFPANFSLSHCPFFGGVLLTFDQNISLGLDLELNHRVGRTVERVSCQRECWEAPAPSLLWVAKEASFKSLPENKGVFLTHLHISDWKRMGETHSFRFRSEGHGQGQGFAFSLGGLSLGCAFSNGRPLPGPCF